MTAQQPANATTNATDTKPANTSAGGDTVAVQLGERTVHVPAGGLFDRFRMQADLDEVARDPRVPGVEFFRDQPKTEVESRIGPTYTPNFYYAMSNAQVAFAAPTRALRRRLPEELDPLEVAPGVGLASLIFFRYDVADIDFYTEAAVGIAVKPPRHGPVGAIDTLATLQNNHLNGYVLSLPVNTDIAQVRGHDGYGFPKWVTDIDVEIHSGGVHGRIANEIGGTDIAFNAPTPKQKKHRTGTAVSAMTSYTKFDNAWHSTFSQTNSLVSGTRLFPRDLDLQLGSGKASDDLRSLEPSRPLMFSVMTMGQLALHMPTVLSI